MASMTTLEGEKLMFTMEGKRGIRVADQNGGPAVVTSPNTYQSNGVIHAIYTVLIPGK